MCRLMTLATVVKAGVGDVRAVGRNFGIIVRTLAMGQCFDRTIRCGHFVHLGIEWVVLEISSEISGDEQGLPIRSPDGGGCREHRAAMRKVAGGELARRAAIGRDDEKLRESRLEVAARVEAIDEAVVDLRG